MKLIFKPFNKRYSWDCYKIEYSANIKAIIIHIAQDHEVKCTYKKADSPLEKGFSNNIAIFIDSTI